MSRYWVGWWSGNYVDEGCIDPPFQCWVSGSKERNDGSERDDLSFCAVIDAKDEASIHVGISKYFPDFEMRFISKRDDNYIPGNRFPDFKNKTKLGE